MPTGTRIAKLLDEHRPALPQGVAYATLAATKATALKTQDNCARIMARARTSTTSTHCLTASADGRIVSASFVL
jgi:hypothetical protein